MVGVQPDDAEIFCKREKRGAVDERSQGSGATVLDFMFDMLAAVLWPGRSRAAQERSSTRKFLKTRQLVFPVFMASGSGRTLGGFVRVDDSSLRFSLDSDGKLRRVDTPLNQFDSYSTAENAPTRKSIPLLIGASSWYVVLRLVGPGRDVTFAYDPRYSAVVESVLDAAGLGSRSAT